MQKRRFQSFLAEGNDLSIPHVEDLDVEEFVSSLKKLKELEAVQKLDGANLRMGLDSSGKFYTSREQKGGKRFYSQSDFPVNSAYDGFRAAHEALKKVEPQLKQVLKPGDAVNMEVLYGPQPNTVLYGKDGVNYVAFLEMLRGDDPTQPLDQTKVKRLRKLLRDQVVHVKTDFSDSTDGSSITRAPKISDWKFTGSDSVDPSDVDEVDVGPTLKKLEKFLSRSNEAASGLGLDLTNFEVLKDKNHKLSSERAALNQTVLDDYKLPIKQALLKLAAGQQPSLRGNVGGDGVYDGIEGIIFTDPETRKKFKVVDRDIFTKINKFNYQVRKGISSRAVSTDPDLPLETRGGIIGQAKLRALRMFGLENAELPSQTKKVLEKLKGSTRAETVKNLVTTLHELNVPALRKKLQAIYISALDDLEDDLDKFKQHADEYELELDNGKKVKYTPEIKRRTLMSFAEARNDIETMLKRIRATDDLRGLIEVFFGKQLDDIHGDKS